MPVTQAAKRKKTADMTDSPPKRVTRARAKNTDTDNIAPKPMAAKITTASAKAVATKKKPAAPTKPTQRKTRADNGNGEVIEEAMHGQEAKPEPMKARGRTKKEVMGEKEESQVSDVPKTRARPTKAPAAEVTRQEAPKTRGRPKKTVETAPAVQKAQEEIENAEPVKKTTRGRPVINATKTQPNAPATRLAAAAQKKRVKFQQESDKENVPLVTEGPQKSAIKPTGLKAKPVRKPAAARATTRGRTGAIPTTQEQELEKKDVLPLSPKKVNQVAKSDPIISEDELAGEKTPIRALSKSPTKGATSPVKDIGSVSKLNFDKATAPSSPPKLMSSSILASPARRPPPSPFKDALKSSPKKVQLGDSINQPVLVSSRTPMTTSFLQESPRRGNIGDNMTHPVVFPSQSSFQQSLLQESPKRGKIEDRTTQPILVPSKSPFKASLLQSPARRPTASPVKSTELGSPLKSSMRVPTFTIPSRQSSPSKAPSFSPEKVISSPWRAARSPERTPKVSTITDEERDVDAEEDGILAICPESPTMQVAAEAEPPLRTLAATFEERVSFDDTIIVDQPEPVTRSDETLEGSKPAETPTEFKGPAFLLASAVLRRVSIESGSEDELASPDKGCEATPLRRHGVSAQDFGTPAVINDQESEFSEDQLSLTPLADQLSSWATSSPKEQNATSRSRHARGMFSLGGAGMMVALEQTIDIPTGSPAKSSFFEDEMAMREGEEDVEEASFAKMDVGNEEDLAALQVSQESQASEEYGDENAMPSDAEMLRAEQDHTLTCTPAKVFTPAKKISQQPREIHTVSKVPLRASADDSPLIITRQRSRSFGGPLSVVSEPPEDSAKHSKIPDDAENENVALYQPATPVLAASTIPQTPGSVMKLDAETPGRTPRKGVIPDVLQGAVVFVDVHTSEGADASGIFVDLLTQMGARCIKQWSWNPRASMGSSLNNSTSHSASPDTAKVGITHVVYKDGGKRTLEKVRSSNGVVLCVGVGWVLDCEREDKWLDEVSYAIDTSMIPRGGSRRRKSMEPRALANMNGNLIPASIETPAKVSIDNEMSPTKEFLTFDTPASRRDTFIIERQTPPDQEQSVAPATPMAVSAQDNMLEDGSAWGSPTTPYYLSKGADLVQRTCPPKQMGFPVTGEIDDQPDETVRRRLLEARRKSMQWASRIRSPLGRTRSFEEVVITGLASDGGLFLPREIPPIPANWEGAWTDWRFEELAFEIFSLYIDPNEIPSRDLKEIVNKSYSNFRAPDVTPLVTLDQEKQLYLLELFHGPTFAFKDVALQLLGNLFEYFLIRKNGDKPESERDHLTVVGATSGDTGSAAIYGLRSKKDVDIMIMFPEGKVSPVQEAQMTSVLDKNVHNVAVDGSFDDCQNFVKELFGDANIRRTHQLAAVNSINWARILAQISYYASSLGRLLRDGKTNASSKIRFVVPTGNFGDVLAGYFAKSMGFPIEKLVVATNENDILDRFWKTGYYEKKPMHGCLAGGGFAEDGVKAHEDGVRETFSPAMDILVSSNFERLLWFLAFQVYGEGLKTDEEKRAEAGRRVKGWLEELKIKGGFGVEPKLLEAAKISFESERVSNKQTIAMIKQQYSAQTPAAKEDASTGTTGATNHGKYILDPHSAIGVEAALRSIQRAPPPETTHIALATAHPAKFSKAVSQALGNEKDFQFRDLLPEQFVGLEELEKRKYHFRKSDGVEGLRKFIREQVPSR